MYTIDNTTYLYGMIFLKIIILELGFINFVCIVSIIIKNSV